MNNNNNMQRRNIDLWTDRNNGFTYKELSEKYRIGRESCRQIYLKIERQKRSKNDV